MKNYFYDILPCDLQEKIERMCLDIYRQDHKKKGYINVIDEFNITFDCLYKLEFSHMVFDTDFENLAMSYDWFYEDNILSVSQFIESLTKILNKDSQIYLTSIKFDDEDYVKSTQEWWNTLYIEYTDNNAKYISIM